MRIKRCALTCFPRPRVLCSSRHDTINSIISLLHCYKPRKKSPELIPDTEDVAALTTSCLAKLYNLEFPEVYMHRILKRKPTLPTLQEMG